MTNTNGTELGDAEQQLVVAHGEGKWNDLSRDDVALVGRVERAVLLPHGTHAGRHTVELLIRTKDGQLVHANTTYALFQGMAQQFQAWYDHSL